MSSSMMSPSGGAGRAPSYVRFDVFFENAAVAAAR
jgi:hypothetical protein